MTQRVTRHAYACTHRETDRQTQTETDRDRQTDRHTTTCNTSDSLLGLVADCVSSPATVEIDNHFLGRNKQ